jgi:hypothetical protein
LGVDVHHRRHVCFTHGGSRGREQAARSGGNLARPVRLDDELRSMASAKTEEGRRPEQLPWGI